ncbi:MAG: hypothetical protein Q8M09_11770 [Pseudomonadota bacterium]|nr:hypothetical protein [Pseudomonadota bacterium]MDP1904907.1 hypothetical protein [Pseudomonadota bacterium]MDP2352030.1 hypothetical protein [Pseudomonadota bacterium]
MNDIVSINRLFLIMAREAAKTKSGEVITGLSRPVLDRLGRLSLVELEELAQGAGLSLISFRLNEAELDRLVVLQDGQRSAYALSVAAARGA